MVVRASTITQAVARLRSAPPANVAEIEIESAITLGNPQVNRALFTIEERHRFELLQRRTNTLGAGASPVSR